MIQREKKKVKKKEKGRARAVFKAYNDLGSFGGATLRCRGLQPLRLDDKRVLQQHRKRQDLLALSHPLRLAQLTMAMAMRKLHFWMESRTTRRTNLRLEKIHLMLNKVEKMEEEEEQDPCRVLPTVDEEDEALFEQEPEPRFPPDPPPGPKAPPAAWLEAKGKGKGKGKPDTEEVDPMWQEILGIEDPPGSNASDDEPAEEQPGGDARGSADPDPAEPVLRPGPAEPLPEPGPAQPADPEELPPGPEVYMAPTGTVYHRRRNCGKLRAARRIFPIPGCPQCSAALRQWQIAFVTQGHYHADRDCTHGSRDARQVPACVECGGLLFQ